MLPITEKPGRSTRFAPLAVPREDAGKGKLAKVRADARQKGASVISAFGPMARGDASAV